MAKSGTIPIDSVIEKFFVRTKLNSEHVIHLASLYKAGTRIPPIRITRDNFLVDGRHRLAALKSLDKKAVDVEWVEETDTGSILVDALSSNVGGSLPPTNSDIVHSFEQMLEAGMVGSEIGAKFTKPPVNWPPAVVRRYVDDAKSGLNVNRLRKAKAAVIDGMVINEAAVLFKVKLDVLKASIEGKRRRKTGLGEYKANLTGIFRSRGGSMGALMKKVQKQWEDEEISWATVNGVLDHLEVLCKGTTHSVKDWRIRLEAKAGKN